MTQKADLENDLQVKGAMRPTSAAALASLAYVVPLVLSRSSSPTPDHPKVFLWYKSLKQPKFKPPDIAVPVAWTLIETSLAIAAYRLLRKQPSANRAASLALLAGNVAAIGGWSRLFFGRRYLRASTVMAAAMVGTGAAFVNVSRQTDSIASTAGVPFVAWVAFATVLTAAIWRRNP
jgi:benzodiazapine receptor